MKQSKIILTILFFVLSFTLNYGQSIVGQWDFDNAADLTAATVGTALESFGSPTAVDGPQAGDGAALLGNDDYYKAPVAIAASGAGSLINTYSLLMDIKVDPLNGWSSLMQNILDNSTDASYFLNGGKKIGHKSGSYSASGTFPEKTWCRTVLVVKENSATDVSTDIYIDGRLAIHNTLGAVDNRLALYDHVLLFRDNDGEEKPTDVAKVVLYDGALSASAVEALGNVGDIVVGRWDFEDSSDLTKATIGADLELVGAATAVAGPGNGAVSLTATDYFNAVTAISPVGTVGEYINTFTLSMDLKVGLAESYNALLSTDILHTNDGDYFITSSGKIGGGMSYAPEGTVTADTWTRIVLVVEDVTVGTDTSITAKTYVDGVLKVTQTGKSFDGRMSLMEKVMLFADNDGENDEKSVSRIVLYNYAMTDGQVSDELVNDPLPVELTSFTAVVADDVVELNWATATEVNNYGFEIESSNDNSSWNKIGFVTGHGNSNSPNSYSFTAVDISKYYRLKQVDVDGGFEYSDVVEVAVNLTYKLAQNYPNPFNPTTTVSFTLPELAKVRIAIYNVLGAKVMDVANGEYSAGVHNLNIDASQLTSGIYFYKLETSNFSKVMKMMLLK